jgi:hypothetical protein
VSVEGRYPAGIVGRALTRRALDARLLDAAIAAGWEQAGRQGLQPQLAPSFQRAAGHLAVLRQMTSDFRDPLVWVVLSLVGRGVVDVVAFVLLDQDLVKHSQAEAAVEQELSVIYGRLGHPLPAPDPGQLKQPDNYAGRIIVAIVTFGIYMLWWFYDQMAEPNEHFTSNWAHEDQLVTAVQAFG